LQRARTGIEAAERDLERCKKAVAKDIDVKTAATNLDRGANPITPWHASQALGAVETADTSLEIATAAHQRLKDELAVLEDDAAEAHNQIIVAIKQTTRPLLEQLLLELQHLRRRSAVVMRAVAELMDEDVRTLPRFYNALRSLKAEQARAAVFAALKADLRSDRRAQSAAAWSRRRNKYRETAFVETIASPSTMHDRTERLSTAAAIFRKRAVKS
jgi:hypothetical protein